MLKTSFREARAMGTTGGMSRWLESGMIIMTQAEKVHQAARSLALANSFFPCRPVAEAAALHKSQKGWPQWSH